MFDTEEEEKIRRHIDNLIEKLQASTRRAQAEGITGRMLLDQTVHAAVNRITPESKVLLSGVYNILMKKTLEKELYNIPRNKAAFYEQNILKELNAKFIFDIPAHIDYEESNATIRQWICTGAVVLVGGVISIFVKTVVPVSIAAVIAGLMAVLLKDGKRTGEGIAKSDKIDALLKAYFQNVRQSLLAWVDGIDAYYDEKIAELERKLVEQ